MPKLLLLHHKRQSHLAWYRVPFSVWHYFRFLSTHCFDDLVLLAGAYADDLKLMANLDHITRVIVQSEISIIYDWSRTIDMPLSIMKSLVIHNGANNSCYQYYCEERALPSLVTFVNLGIVRCFDAIYGEQIATVAQNGKRLVELCLRLLSCRNADFVLRVYKTYVLPVMLYVSVIWFLPPTLWGRRPGSSSESIFLKDCW